jgi:hypothetical protein
MLNIQFYGPYDARLMVGMNHKPSKILEGMFRGKNMFTLLKNCRL